MENCMAVVQHCVCQPNGSTTRYLYILPWRACGLDVKVILELVIV